MSRKIIRTIKEYPVQAAGKTWTIKNVQLEKSESKSEVIPSREITRINRFVANEICCAHSILTGDDLEFLCDLTTTKYTEVALKVGLTKSVISKWVSKGSENIPFAPSLILKKWFWSKVFDSAILNAIPPSLIFDDDKLFDYLKSKAAS